jgi:hypothetical protein
MSFARACLFLALLAPAARAQTPLVSEGDPIAGVGAVQTFLPSADVLDSGSWSLLADTDNANILMDVALIRDGAVVLREGSSLDLPAGGVLGTIVSVDWANHAEFAAILTTRTPTTTGVYWNSHRIVDMDTPIPSPAVGADSRWVKFEVVKTNESRQVLVLGEIDNTALGGFREDALIRYDLDAHGDVLATTVLATNGQLSPALGEPLIGLAIAPNEHVLALNARGDFLTVMRSLGGDALIVNGDTVVAREGVASSVGVPWRTLDLAKVGINDFGEFVMSGTLGEMSETLYLIEKNGQKFARSGDVLAGFSSSPLTAGRAAPIEIAGTGHVFWRAETQTGEVGFLRDHEPIVKAGTTLVGGNLVLSLPSNQHAFAISPDGRFFLGRIQQLENVGESTVLVDFGLVLRVPGCSGNAGMLTHVSGDARVGQTFRLGMDAGQEPGVLAMLAFSRQARVLGSGCGAPTLAGELLIAAPLLGTVALPPWNGTAPSTLALFVPNDPALVDLELHAQGLFQDVTGPTFQAPRLTNALRIQIGAP